MARRTDDHDDNKEEKSLFPIDDGRWTKEMYQLHPFAAHYLTQFCFLPLHKLSPLGVWNIRGYKLDAPECLPEKHMYYVLRKGTVLYHASPTRITKFDRLAFFSIERAVSVMILMTRGRLFSVEERDMLSTEERNVLSVGRDTPGIRERGTVHIFTRAISTHLSSQGT